MTTDTVPQTVLFPDLFDKPLFAKFNQEQASSDGGAVLLKAAERVYGLVKAFARRLSDKRAPEKIRHTLADPDRPAHLRHRLRPSRLQRCRAPRRRPHPQAAARPRPGGGRVTGLAADAVAVRERSRPRRALRRCRGSRTQPAAARSTWGASWRRVLSSATAAGWGGFGVSRSIWTRPTTRRTAPSSTASSMGTMTTGVIKDRISMVTLCSDIAQARLLEEPTQQGWRPL